MPTTPINGLPSPVDGSPNDPPIHFDALNTVLDSRMVPRFATIAARNAAITAPFEGQVCHVAASTTPALPPRFMVYSESMWRLVGPTPLAPVIGPWTEPPGTFSASTTTLTSLVIPDPGFPYRISVSTNCEMGSVAAGTRWDLWVRIANSSNNGNLDYEVARAELVVYQRVDSPIAPGIYTGSMTVFVEARRAYGTANGQITANNKRLNVYRHAG